MTDTHDIQELLDLCEKELRRSKEDDTLADVAPAAFGRLATRVEQVIERRQNTDRRATARATPDRRVAPPKD